MITLRKKLKTFSLTFPTSPVWCVDSSLSLSISGLHLDVPSPSSCEAECWNWIFGWNVSVSDTHCRCSLLFIYIARVYYVKNLSEMWTRDCTAIFCLIRLEKLGWTSSWCRREKAFCRSVADEIFKIWDGKELCSSHLRQVPILLKALPGS